MAYDLNAKKFNVKFVLLHLCNLGGILLARRKSEAIGSARNAYEDAYQRVQDARAEVDEAEVGVPSQSLIVRWLITR